MTGPQESGEISLLFHPLPLPPSDASNLTNDTVLDFSEEGGPVR